MHPADLEVFMYNSCICMYGFIAAVLSEWQFRTCLMFILAVLHIPSLNFTHVSGLQPPITGRWLDRKCSIIWWNASSAMSKRERSGDRSVTSDPPGHRFSSRIFY